MKLIRRILWFPVLLLSLLSGEVAGREDAVRGFVSVEPFEIRLEALVRVSVYRESWRISDLSVTPANREGILDNVATLMESGVTLAVRERAVSFTGRELRFVRQDPVVGYVTDERGEIPLEEAMVGVTFSAGVRGVESFSGEWLWYPPGQERVTIEISSRGRPSARYVTSEAPVFSWAQQDATEAPSLLPVPSVEQVRGRPLWFLTYIAIGLGMIATGTIIVKKQESPAWVGSLVVAALVSALLGFTIRETEVAIPKEDEVREITFRILRNIYHAFDFREESSVYDTLEESVTGPLLERVYLEIQSALELESLGGPRVKVHEVALRESNLVAKEGAGGSPAMTVAAHWATVGSVSHWGHTHERVNRYEAELTIVPSGTQWKLEQLDLKNEERVQKVSRNQIAAPPVSDRESGEEPVRGKAEEGAP